ncbi:LURP-one-related/scramblase family protein [Janibacter anophelis]|uniref:LURP-one-related/scramblase family protein n=1 Tax=Janibacter anophelis TaxID=319054 RepID=UPI000DEEE738|nr:hypothetical protein [Janibacter anophelis]
MGILDTDAIVLDQVRSFLSNDFGIHDLAGTQIGRIVTEGGMGSRLLMGSRQLAIVDTDGTLLVRVVDPPNLGLDRFEVQDWQGQVVKEFTFFKKALRIELSTGPQLRLEGSMWDREFTVTGPGRARGHREPSLAGGRRGIPRPGALCPRVHPAGAGPRKARHDRCRHRPRPHPAEGTQQRLIPLRPHETAHLPGRCAVS